MAVYQVPCISKDIIEFVIKGPFSVYHRQSTGLGLQTYKIFRIKVIEIGKDILLIFPPVLAEFPMGVFLFPGFPILLGKL